MNDGYLTLLSSTQGWSSSSNTLGEFPGTWQKKPCAYVVVGLRRISTEICTLQNEQGQNVYLPSYILSKISSLVTIRENKHTLVQMVGS